MKQEIRQRANRAAASSEELPRRLCDLPAIDPPGTRRKSSRSIRCFSDWIEKEPLEKWSLLHDTHGARYGIMTTNLAEVYNWVLRGMRGLPLVAIVEGVMHGTIRYLQQRYAAACLHTENYPATPYCARAMAYMEEKSSKAQMHTVIETGTAQHRFEVYLRDKSGFGTANFQRTQEVVIGMGAYPNCTCSYNKPLLLHKPCSHVIAACGKFRMDPREFVCPYLMKDAVSAAWSGEIRGFRVVGNFAETAAPADRVWVPDLTLIRARAGRRKVRRIRNDMDQSEAGGPTMMCIECGNYGHRMNQCPNVGSTSAAGEEAAVSTTISARGGRGRGRRGRRGGSQAGEPSSLMMLPGP
jgi:hypothetical protein